MKYRVLIEESDEGFAVSVPGLPGCHSQGRTETEALENIAAAIREYLEAADELAGAAGGKLVEVEVETCRNYPASTTLQRFER